MVAPAARLTSTGNFLINGTYGFDEATYDPGSTYSKNLCAYSQSYVITGSVYTGWRVNYGSAIVKTNEIAPDGTPTAARIRFGQYTYSSVSTPFCWVPNLTLILSAWVRVDSGTRSFFFSPNGGGFNASFTATSTWTRVSVPAYANYTSYVDGINLFVNDGRPGGEVLIWGMQIEIGNVVTDYEPTGASAYVYIPPGFTTRLDPTGFYTIGSLDEVSINQSSSYSQNLLSYSQQLTTGYGWGLTGATAAYGSSAPDGTPTATLITEDTSVGNSHWDVNGNVYITPKTFYTLSCYYKIYSGDRQFYFTTFDAGAPGGSSYAGVVISNDGKSFTSSYVTGFFSNGTYSITPVGNGWNRVVMTFQTGPTPGLFLRFRLGLYNNGAQYYDGNGTSGLYVWGPQFELGTTATDYVPTGAGAAPIAPFVERKASTGLHRIAGAYDEASLNPASGYIKNYVSYSQNFSSIWSSGGGVYSNVLANVAMAPDGTMTASKLVETANNNYHVLYQAPNNNGIPGQVYCNSIYVKAAERYVFQMYAGGSSNWSTTPSGTFNLLTGTVLPGTFNLPAFITPVGNGWYRCSTQGICAYPPTGGLILSTNFGTCLPGTTTVVYQGDGNSGIYIWGAQMELSTLNAGPSTYIATGLNGSPLT